MSIQTSFERVVAGHDLSRTEAAEVVDEIVTSDVEPALAGGLLVALRMKGETADELAGFAEAMRQRAVPVTPKATPLADTCGTGGDGKKTVNISTMAALVLAASGVAVAKHGNRALSSSTGSGDVFEALGIPLDLDADAIARCIDGAGIGFLFAPALHPAMAKIMPIRRALGTRTIFNILGPLTNPAQPDYQLVGVAAPHMVELVAGALAKMSTTRAVVVHGAGGTDELTCAGPNDVAVVDGSTVTTRTLAPGDVGLDTSPLAALAGGEPEQNAEVVRATLGGEKGPVRDAVLLNAGVALLVSGQVGDPATGVVKAAELIDSGAAAERLDRFVAAASS